MLIKLMPRETYNWRRKRAPARVSAPRCRNGSNLLGTYKKVARDVQKLSYEGDIFPTILRCSFGVHATDTSASLSGKRRNLDQHGDAFSQNTESGPTVTETVQV